MENLREKYKASFVKNKYNIYFTKAFTLFPVGYTAPEVPHIPLK